MKPTDTEADAAAEQGGVESIFWIFFFAAVFVFVTLWSSGGYLFRRLFKRNNKWK